MGDNFFHPSIHPSIYKASTVLAPSSLSLRQSRTYPSDSIYTHTSPPNLATDFPRPFPLLHLFFSSATLSLSLCVLGIILREQKKMSVEIHEEAVMASPNNHSSSSVSNDVHSPGIAKGNRIKRRRQLPLQSPTQATAASSSSTSSSGQFSGSATEEEEDMANCLILLAQGRALDADPKSPEEEEVVGDGGRGERFTSRRLAEATTTTNGKVGFYVYECKTCSKCFPSFQALGGHRASHKKPKTAPVAAVIAMEEKKGTHHDDVLPIRSIPSYPNPRVIPVNNGGSAATPALLINSNGTRVHECSICGSEFSSGQALGGHMRRHRAVVAAPEPPHEAKKEKHILSLDLNLPAPMEDERGELPKSPPFHFSGKKPLIFSASPLVDCHY